MIKNLFVLASIVISSPPFADCLLMTASPSEKIAQIMSRKGYPLIQVPAEVMKNKTANNLAKQLMNIMAEGA